MTKSIRIIAAIVMLLMLIGIVAADTDITVRPSVMVECSVSPAYLMPGDTGTVSVTLKNGATDYVYRVPGTGNTTDLFELTAPVIYAGLTGNEYVKVTSGSYENVGILGPGDTIDFTYSIQVNDDTEDGIYFLDFNFMGGSDMYDVNWKIPVTVESSNIKIIRSESSANSGYIVLDIANTRPNTINAVTVIPVSDDIEFDPDQYFIGTMEADEMFTIQFALQDNVNTNEDVGFKVVYRNGNTWHESKVQTIPINASSQMIVQSQTPDVRVLGIVGVVLLFVVGFFIVMRRKRMSEGEM